MINFRLRLCLGLAMAAETLPKLGVFADGILRERGIRMLLAFSFSRSRARTFSESGGSFMCDASVGSDQREGEVPERMEGDCARVEPKGTFREVLGVSRDVLPAFDVADERVAVDDKLGRDRGSSRSVTGAVGSMTEGLLNFHVDVDLSQEDAWGSEGSVRSERKGTRVGDKPEECGSRALESPRVRTDAAEGADPWAPAPEISEEIEGRLVPKDRWKLRRGDGDANLRWPERKGDVLRGVDGGEGCGVASGERAVDACDGPSARSVVTVT